MENTNNGSRIQIQNFLQKVVEEFKNPNPLKKIKEKRQLKRKKIAAQFGL